VSVSDAQSAAAAAVSGSRLPHATHPAAAGLAAAGYYLMPNAAYQSPYVSGLCAARRHMASATEVFLAHTGALQVRLLLLLLLLPPPRRLCFCWTLFVCLSVCVSKIT